MEGIAELVAFLSDEKPEVRAIAAENVMALTGTPEGIAALRQTDAVAKLVPLLGDVLRIAHDSAKALTNLSGDEEFVRKMLDAGLVERLVDMILSGTCAFTDLCAMILSNCTRGQAGADRLLQVHDEKLSGTSVAKLVVAFDEERNSNNLKLNWLGTVFNNVTQFPSGRALFLDKDRGWLPMLLPHIGHANIIRRGGIVGLVRNCVFDQDSHPWLLSEAEVDILPAILRPLMDATPLEEEDAKGLPASLVALPADKARETDPEIRKMLVDTLIIFGGTRAGRDFLISRKTYPVIRAAHQVEDDEETSEQMHKLVEILLCELKDDDDSEAAADGGAEAAAASDAVPLVENPELEEMD